MCSLGGLQTDTRSMRNIRLEAAINFMPMNRDICGHYMPFGLSRRVERGSTQEDGENTLPTFTPGVDGEGSRPTYMTDKRGENAREEKEYNMNEEMLQKLNTVLYGLDNITVVGRANVRNLDTCIQIMEDVVRSASDLLKREAAETDT